MKLDIIKKGMFALELCACVTAEVMLYVHLFLIIAPCTKTERLSQVPD